MRNIIVNSNISGIVVIELKASLIIVVILYNALTITFWDKSTPSKVNTDMRFVCITMHFKKAIHTTKNVISQIIGSSPNSVGRVF